LSQQLKVEIARVDGRLLGWRLTARSWLSFQTLLVWADDSFPGFRDGESFCPGLGERITYEEVISPDINFLGEGI
jgi:hypothetical protein